MFTCRAGPGLGQGPAGVDIYWGIGGGGGLRRSMALMVGGVLFLFFMPRNGARKANAMAQGGGINMRHGT